MKTETFIKQNKSIEGKIRNMNKNIKTSIFGKLGTGGGKFDDFW